MSTDVFACHYRILCVYIKATALLPTKLCGDVYGMLCVYLKASVCNCTELRGNNKEGFTELKHNSLVQRRCSCILYVGKYSMIMQRSMFTVHRNSVCTYIMLRGGGTEGGHIQLCQKAQNAPKNNAEFLVF
jgi:hypothetical protein